MLEDLHQSADAATEDVQVAGVRIAAQTLLHLQGQPVHTLAHIGGSGRQPDPDTPRKPESPRQRPQYRRHQLRGRVGRDPDDRVADLDQHRRRQRCRTVAGLGADNDRRKT